MKMIEQTSMRSRQVQSRHIIKTALACSDSDTITQEML